MSGQIFSEKEGRLQAKAEQPRKVLTEKWPQLDLAHNKTTNKGGSKHPLNIISLTNKSGLNTSQVP